MGYKKKINKEDILRSEIVKRLNELSRIGESRHQAKLNSKDGKLPFIYSIRTYENYKHSMELLVSYCIRNHPNEINHVGDAEPYIEEYINWLIQNDYSAYTQKSFLSSYRKFGGKEFKEIYTQSRKRSRIGRSRTDVAHARQFSEEAHQDLIGFCNHTGLRRSELESLRNTPGCVSQHSDGNWYINKVKGKGGRVRDVPILNNDQQVIDKILNTPENELVGGRVHNKAPIHTYRSNYCMALYNSIARDVDTLDRKELYICRGDLAGVKLDRKSLITCTKALGHNRQNVIPQHYIRKEQLKDCKE